MDNQLLLGAKYLITRIMIFVPLLAALLTGSSIGIILATATAALYFTANHLLRSVREASRCLYENKEITLIYIDGTSQRLVLEDIECYCKLPVRTGIHNQSNGRIKLSSLPASVIIKLKNTDASVQIETANINHHLLQLIETHVEEVPSKVLCPPASAWVPVLQCAYMVLMVVSCLYIGSQLQQSLR